MRRLIGLEKKYTAIFRPLSFIFQAHPPYRIPRIIRHQQRSVPENDDADRPSIRLILRRVRNESRQEILRLAGLAVMDGTKITL